MTELGTHYDLPVYINVGLTDSKCVDAQAGLEAAASLLMGVLAGADVFGHMGIAGVDQASSLEMLVFQHEVIEYVEHAVRSITIDDEHLLLVRADRLLRKIAAGRHQGGLELPHQQMMKRGVGEHHPEAGVSRRHLGGHPRSSWTQKDDGALGRTQ